MLNKATENSGSMALAKKLRRGYCFVLGWLAGEYRGSRLCSLCRAFREGSRINFRHTFLARLIRETRQNSRAILKNARLFTFLSSLFKKIKFRVSGYLRTSAAGNSLDRIRQEVSVSKIKTASLFLLVIILINTSFLVLFKKEMSFFPWFSRAIFLLAAAIGLNCGNDWRKLQETSFIAKQINKYYKREG